MARSTASMLTVEQGEGRFRVETPAKINIGLRVLGRRADGYHEIESLVMAVDLTDRLEGRPAGGGALSLEVAGGDGSTPADETNLVLRAGRLLRQEAGVREGASIRLEKRIPVGRGLGGGSSDAAAALVLLNALWGLGLSRAELTELGARVGSDVAFFLNGPLAVMRGRGEVIERLDWEADVGVLLVVPPFGLSTREVYGRWEPALTTHGGQAILWATLLRDGKVEELGREAANDLERAAQALRGEISGLRQALERAGARCVLMTGSGSAVYAIAPGEREVRRMKGELHVGPGVEVYALGPWKGKNSLPAREGEQPWK